MVFGPNEILLVRRLLVLRRAAFDALSAHGKGQAMRRQRLRGSGDRLLDQSKVFPSPHGFQHEDFGQPNHDNPLFPDCPGPYISSLPTHTPDTRTCSPARLPPLCVLLCPRKLWQRIKQG